MKNSAYDKLSEKFESHHPMLDNDELWNNIEPKLKKKKKNRFLLWFFFGAALLTAFYFSDFAKVQNKKPITVTPVEDIMEHKIETKNTADNSTQQINKESLESNLPKGENKNKTSLGSLSMKTKTLSNGHDLNLKSKRIIPIRPKENRIELFENQSSIGAKTAISKSGLDKEDNRFQLNLKQEELEDEKLKPTSNSKERNPLPIVKDDPAKPNSDLNQAELKTIAENASSNTSSVPKTKKEKFKKKKSKKKKHQAKNKAKEEPRKVKKYVNRNRWNYLLQAKASPTLSLHTNQRNGIGSEDLDRRNEALSTLESFSLGGSLQAIHQSGFIITGGLQFQQMIQRVSLSSIVIEEEIRQVVTEEVHNAQNETIRTNSGSVLVETQIKKDFRLFNQYRLINMPIGLGYELKTRKSRFKFLGGMDLNLHYKFKGSYLNPDLSLNLLDNNAFRYKKIYRQNIGLGFWTAFEMNKALTKRMNFVLGSSIQIPFKSLTIDDAAIQENWYRFNLDLGINYLLNPNKRKKKK